MPTTSSTNTTAASASGTARLPWWGLLALSTAAFTDVMTDLLPAGLLPQMNGALRVPEERIGLLVSAFAIASALAAIPVTAALRRLPRRSVLIGVLIGFALFDAATAFSSSYLLTFLARLLVGVLGGTLWSMLAGYAARMVPADRRGRAIAIILASITVALSLGIPAGTALATAFGWRTSFALLAALALLLVAWVRWKVPRFPGEAAAERTPLRRVASLRGIPTVLLVTVLLLTGHQAMYTYIAPFAENSGFGHTSLVLLDFGHRHPGRHMDRRHPHRRPGPGRGRHAHPGPGRTHPGAAADRRSNLGGCIRWSAHTAADRPGRRFRPRQRGCGDLHADHGL